MKSKIIYSILLVLTALPHAGAQQNQSPLVKNVLFINSYHKGYPSSDAIMQGYHEAVDGKFIRTEYYFMDTKQNSHPQIVQNHVNEAIQLKSTFQPDVIVVSDDDAVKHLLVPHWAKGPTPVIFCGVNWSSKLYGLPNSFVTGMVEVQPIGGCIQLLREQYPDLRRLTILTEDAPATREIQTTLEPMYKELGIEANYVYVSNFEEWKKGFTEANLNADAVFAPTYGTIKGWNEDEAARFVEENIKKPVFTCDDLMMKCAVFGLTPVAKEQGEWAGNTVLQIILGKPVNEIPPAQNKQAKVYFNSILAEKIGFKLPEAAAKQFETAP